MHDCPFCDAACYCDLEDHYQPAPADCRHECAEEECDDWDAVLDDCARHEWETDRD